MYRTLPSAPLYSKARQVLTFAKTHQPSMPASGATSPRDSQMVLLWNGVNATRKFESNFILATLGPESWPDALGTVALGACLGRAANLAHIRLPECSSPTCSFRLLWGAKPSLALTDVHSDPGVEFLARHVVDPFTVLIHIAFDNGFGRRRSFSC
jgi:hypothetical protein